MKSNGLPLMVAVVFMVGMGTGVREAAAGQFVKTGITHCSDGSAVITPCPSPGEAFYGQDACLLRACGHGHAGRRLVHDPGQCHGPGLGGEDRCEQGRYLYLGSGPDLLQ